MEPSAEQLIRDYLNQLSVAARTRLRSDERRAFLARMRIYIERKSGVPGTADPAAVARILSALGDPVQAVERERARLAEERRERAAAATRSGLWRPQRRGGTPDADSQPADDKDAQPAAGPTPAANAPQIAGRPLTGEYTKKQKRPVTSRWRPGAPMSPRPSRSLRVPRPRAAGSQPPDPDAARTSGAEAGPKPAAPRAAEPGPAGSRSAGAKPAGPGPADPKPVGRAPAGPRADGHTSAGHTSAGHAPAGPPPAGQAPAGQTPAGSEAVGPAPAGSSPASPRPAESVPSGTASADASPGPVSAGMPPVGPAPGAAVSDAAVSDGAVSAGPKIDGPAPDGSPPVAPAPDGGRPSAPGAQGASGTALSDGAPSAVDPSEVTRSEAAGSGDDLPGPVLPGAVLPGAGAQEDTAPRVDPAAAEPDGRVPTRPMPAVPPTAARPMAVRRRRPRRQQPADFPQGLARQVAYLWRQNRLEGTAVVLLALGGLIYPWPIWLLGFAIWLVGVMVSVPSRLWSLPDKWAGLAGPLALVIVGTPVSLMLGGTRPAMGAYVHEALTNSAFLIRVGALLGAGYLAWRIYRGPRAPALPPWNRPHRI